ncbi:MAG: hypothetical protein ACON4B_01500 [Flavobacteriaceae bacterium]
MTKTIVLLTGLLYMGCVIQDPKPEECTIIKTYISQVREGTSFDIIFDDNRGDHYYINRGLERGLNIDTLKKLVTKQTVRLHLPTFWIGTSEHIAQIEIKNDTLFTEFD